MTTGNVSFPQGYLNDIQNDTFVRMDSKDNGGNGDGKISLEEAYADLKTDSLFSGLEQGSAQYTKLKGFTDKIPEALAKYAGDDKTFSAQEWAQFLNGDEWGSVLDAYHSSSNSAQLEMGWIDNQQIQDGNTTKGEVKVGIINNAIQTTGQRLDTTEIEAIIDKYAGDDGIFSVEEYTNLKNDSTYKAFLEEYNLSPLKNKDTGGTAKKNAVHKAKKEAPQSTQKGGIAGFFDKICKAIDGLINKE